MTLKNVRKEEFHENYRYCNIFNNVCIALDFPSKKILCCVDCGCNICGPWNFTPSGCLSDSKLECYPDDQRKYGRCFAVY